MIRLLIQSVKADKFSDVIRTLEQYCAVDGVLVTSCCVAAGCAAVAKVYAALCRQTLEKKKRKKKKSPISLLGKLPSAKFEKKRKIGCNFIFSPPPGFLVEI